MTSRSGGARDVRRVARIVVIVGLLGAAIAVAWTLYDRNTLSESEKAEIAAAIERYHLANATSVRWPLDLAAETRLPDDVGARLQSDYDARLRETVTDDYLERESLDVADFLNEWRVSGEFALVTDQRCTVSGVKLADELRLAGDRVVVDVALSASQKTLPVEERDGVTMPAGPVDPARATWVDSPAHNYRFVLVRVDGEWRVDGWNALPPFG